MTNSNKGKIKVCNSQAHDWAYNNGIYSTKRKCIKCGSSEVRDVYNTISSNWYVKLKD